MVSKFKIKDNWNMAELRLQSEFVPAYLSSRIVTYLKNKGNYDLRLEGMVFNILNSLNNDVITSDKNSAVLCNLIILTLDSVNLKHKTEEQIKGHFESLLSEFSDSIELNFSY